ncbi:MAG: hypothetical protein LH468_06605 [Nocardioides sp.]|nr:hypothetical protein [Nocardioides sp.]
MSRATLLRAGLLVLLLVAAVVVQLVVGLPDQVQLRSVLDGLGRWAVPAFGLTAVTWPSYVAATAVGIVPGTAL